MSHIYAIAEKIFFVILIMGAGVLTKKLKLVSDQGEKDLSVLMMDFVWPAFIFSSIVTTLSADDILSNILLPVLSVGLHLTGYILGMIICRIAGYKGERRNIFLLHAAMNNFLVMALPFAEFFFPAKGAALLAVANLGSMVSLWTLGVSTVVTGNLGLKTTLRNIFSPGLIATLAAILCVLTGINKYIPVLFTSALSVIGGPTMLLGLLVAGTQIYKLGKGALKLDGWNILVGLVRNILTPGALFAIALLLRGVIGSETLTILMIVSITPASVNSVTIAMKFDSAANLAAEGVVFTHLLAMGTMIGFIMLIERFIFAG
ncbi:MAG: AEC family transporter [Spirochaetales bacterium]|jgi:predicted permease|nr:AEC family transporter [Spirochaetales bacterium]